MKVHRIKKVTLTKKENAFLKLLIDRLGVIVTFEQTMDHVWGGEFATNNSIRTLAWKLRNKLESNLIKNASGRGYYIDEWNKPEHIIL